ncbi:MAG: CoA-binding protein [Gammaproteobacteria bacterium]|nr:MAG: CoA-binding protein [Gammaproteobacteria bacterium]
MSLSVAIIGASHKPQRYAYQAQVLLTENGHTVLPVSGNGREILGVAGYSSINDLPRPVDTVTLYLNPQRHLDIQKELLELKPRRIIFNPGTESDALEQFYQNNGILTEQACTLVLLKTGQFE